jgi:predicted nuclease with TOPRIM domain
MTGKDITNRQLLEALTFKFNKRFDSLEGCFDTLESRFDSLEGRFDNLESRFDTLEEMVAGVKEAVMGIADDMATSEEFEGFKKGYQADFDNLELRLGRRIDNMHPRVKKRKFIPTKA